MSQLVIAASALLSAAPGGAPAPPPGIAELSEELITWLKWGVLTAGTVGILSCAGMIVVGGRRRGRLAQDGLLGSVWVIGGLSLASVMVLLVSVLAG